MTWDGKERRMSQFDSDIYQKIIETHTNVSNLVKTFDAHVILDDKRETEIKEKLDFHQKIVYGGVGIIVAVEFISKIFK